MRQESERDAIKEQKRRTAKRQTKRVKLRKRSQVNVAKALVDACEDVVGKTRSHQHKINNHLFSIKKKHRQTFKLKRFQAGQSSERFKEQRRRFATTST